MAKIPDDLEKRLRMIEEASRSLEAYNKLLAETQFLSENINHIEEKRNEIAQFLLDAKAELRAYEEGHITLTRTQVDETKKAIAAWKLALKTEEDLLAAAKEELRIRRDAIKEVNKLNLTLNTTLNITKKLGEKVLQQTGYFIEQQKSVKETELSMGILSNQSKGFRGNIYRTAISTNQIGVNTAELAKMQGTYADNVGRAMQLSEDQLSAIAEIGRGTMLGTEASAELVANFETIGISARGTADFVQEILVTSTKMGVANSKVLKTIQKNLKLVNRFNFQGGVKGLGKMAALATKFKFEMESIAGFAEELMTPEGAVEVAAKLQVLGGEWAKLGDPFELMYRSRNDLTGLTEDIIEATTKTAKFNELTGEFTIDPMEMSRLREISKVIGVSVEELSEMSKTSAKLGKIKTLIPSIFNKEDKEYLSSLTTYNADSKEFEVTMQTKDGTVTESITALRKITPEMVKTQQQYTETLKERAKRSQTFNERFDNLINSFKSGLLPAFEVVADVLESAITSLEPSIKGIAEFITEWPKVTAVVGSVLAGISLIGKEAMWLLRGRLLGKGFMSQTGGLGGAGGGSGSGAGLFGKMTKGGGLKGFGGNVGKGLKSIGARGGGLLSAGFSGYDEWNENSDSGMDSGENAARTAMRGGGAGLGAWGGAAAGAAIGSVVPVIGTLIGGIIGGALGAWGGDALGDAVGDASFGGSGKQSNPQLNDFISRPGESPVSFSSDDTLVGAKTGGPIDKLLEQSISKPGENDNSKVIKNSYFDKKNSAKNIQMVEVKNSSNTSNDKVLVNFNQPLKIEGRLELSSGNNQADIDLNDPILMRDLAKMIQVELSKAISGGKVGSNPISFA